MFQRELADDLVKALDRVLLRKTSRHLTLALSAYDRKEWEGANGQLRTFVESFCDEVATKHAFPKKVSSRGAARKHRGQEQKRARAGRRRP